MKKLLVLFIPVACLFMVSQAQDKSDKTKLSRKERKELKRKEAEKEKQRLLEFARDSTWVIETHTVFDRYHNSYIMNPTINFVSVIDDEATVQLSFSNLPGWNGLGGITMDGSVDKYEVKPNKEGKPFTIEVRASGAALGAVDLFITVNSAANASCTLRGNFGERLTFTGKFVNAAESNVYKGSSFN